MNRWKENLGTKKRTGDGAARWARRIFCAFLIVIGCLVLADGVGDAVRRAENRDSQSEGNVEHNIICHSVGMCMLLWIYIYMVK